MKASSAIIGTSVSLEKFLSVAFLVPINKVPSAPDCIWGLPTMLHGSPGIGKSARVFAAAKSIGLDCGIVELGGRQPEDASGAPFLTKNDELVIACLLDAVNRLNKIGRGVLFLDEVTCGRPATQGAFLSMVQERRVGDMQFSNEIRIVLAGNPPSEAAGGYDLQPPMANRMAHRDELPPSVEDFTSYLLQGSGAALRPIDQGQRTVVEKWQDEYPKVQGLMIGYINRFKQHLHKVPPSGDPNRGKAFPTPRTFEYAGRAVAAARCLGEDANMQAALFSSCMGPAAAVDWETWLHTADLPDPLVMLEKGWTPDKTRLDRTVAALSSATAYVLGRNDAAERLKLAPAMWGLLSQTCGAGLADIALAPAQTLVRGGFGTKAGKAISDVASPVLLRFGKAGLEEMA